MDWEEERCTCTISRNQGDSKNVITVVIWKPKGLVVLGGKLRDLHVIIQHSPVQHVLVVVEAIKETVENVGEIRYNIGGGGDYKHAPQEKKNLKEITKN